MKEFEFLTPQQNQKLKMFHDELVMFKHLLTKNQPEKEIPRLLTDGVLSGRAFQNISSPFVDVGSGFGFPGIVFSILYPEKIILLLEPSEKRSEFLKHCVSKLELSPRTKVIPKPLHSMNEKVFLFKAFSSLDKTLTLIRKHLPLDITSYHFKSAPYQKEWEGLNLQQRSLWEMSLFFEYDFESKKRYILKIKSK